MTTELDQRPIRLIRIMFRTARPLRSFYLSVAVATVLASTAWNVRGEETVRPWQIVELQWSAQRTLTDPYVDGLPEGGSPYLKVILRRTDNEAQGTHLEVPGFWDGGQDWKVRFALPAGGHWSYSTESADPGLAGQRGTIVCQSWSEPEKKENPTRRGLLQVCRDGPRPGRYLQYADGMPCLWLGDTWWNWTKRGIRFESFQKLADDRAAKGFNVGQLFFAGNGWGRDASLLDATYRIPDLDHIRRVEKMIAYANAKGITVWIHAWWARAEMKTQIGEENIRRWWRYVVHRLAAYNVIWVLAGEYNMDNYGGLGLAFWKNLGAMIEKEDPYPRAISAHPTPPFWKGGADAPQWSTAEVLHQETWLGYNQSQTGHGRSVNELIPRIVSEAYRREPAKPIVVTEPWYEFTQGNPTAADVRFGGWSAVLSGAAGHSYGGGHVWKAHLPESPAGRDAWPMEAGFGNDTLNYPGARSLGFMAKFLRGIDWWLLEPHPELVLENASNYCGAVPGKLYVVYLRWGGVAKVDLHPSTEKDSFEYQWIDLGEEKVRKSGTVGGGAIRQFSAPEQYPTASTFRDWVLYLRRK